MKQSILNVFKKYRIHILIWLFMLSYLAFAPNLYVRFILKNEKPAQFKEELPPATDLITFWVDQMDSLVSNGRVLYNLRGWAFLHEESDQSQYERFIVLQSGAENYFFPAQSLERPDVQKAFPDLTINVQNSGFSAFISKDLLPRGSYRIAIMFRHQSSDTRYLVVTPKMIVRTANKLLLKSYKSKP